MTGRLTITYKDHNRETSRVSVRIPELADGVSVDNMTTFYGPAANLREAITDVQLGVEAATSYLARSQITAAPEAAAADANAQRERKWLVRFYDAVTFEMGSFEVPNANLALLQTNSEYMDISSGLGAIFKEAIESYTVSRDGNAVVVVDVQHVGRNT